MEHMAERSQVNPGHTLAVAAAGTLLILVAFTIPLATLSRTAADLGAGGGGRQASMVPGSAAGGARSPWRRPPVSKEAAGGTAVLERDGPHDADGAAAHWPGRPCAQHPQDAVEH
jgi:hypothetical protein